MPDRRSVESFTHLREDRGIFKTGVVWVRLELTPLRRTTSRGDVAFIAFVENTQVEAIIPGRRVALTGPLFDAIGLYVSRANAEARRNGGPLPAPLTMRYPVDANGTWRTRLFETEDSVERRYQFLAAQWTFRNAKGVEVTYGTAPEDEG